MDKHKIIKTTTTQYGVTIELENGVVLDINSNNGHYYFSLCRVKLPLLIGHANSKVIDTNNTFECIYEKNE